MPLYRNIMTVFILIFNPNGTYISGQGSNSEDKPPTSSLGRVFGAEFLRSERGAGTHNKNGGFGTVSRFGQIDQIDHGFDRLVAHQPF